MIRRSKITSESWKNLNWKKFRKDLFRLQCRVFKAVRAGDKRVRLVRTRSQADGRLPLQAGV